MNAEIEAALESYLTTALEAGFPEVFFRAGTKRADLPANKQVAVAVVKEVPRMPVAGQLFKGMLSLVITTPVIEGMTVAEHSELVRAVRWWLQPRVDSTHDAEAVDAALEALDAAMVEKTQMHCRSTRVEGPRDQHTSEEWVTTTETMLLLTED
jgi:hypothetical protein